jgi:N-acetylglucosaminyldiphosphoundecaprenol N-acetyl-beta-D-mannosaminyltransferase
MGVSCPTELPFDSVDILGVRVHQVTMSEAVAYIETLIRRGGYHQVVTVNGAMLVQAVRDPRARALLNSAALAIPDGMGVLLVGRILGTPFPERVPGVDLVGALCAMAAREEFRLYLLGARPEVIEAAAAAIQARHRGVEIAGVHKGYLNERDVPELLADIRTSGPHLLLVGMGWPRQEEWISAHRDSLGSVVCIGVGGTFDVLAGRSQRAPQWMQQVGLEWAYRGIREPKRWRVIVTLPWLLWFALRKRLERLWVRKDRNE